MKPFPFLAPFQRWVERRRSSEAVILVLLSIVVGLSSGAGVWVFKRLIDLFHALAFDVLGRFLAPLGSWSAVIPTVLGALAVGWIARRLIGSERHSGVAGIMESVALAGGRLAYKLVPAKTVAAAFSIGVGASVGPEDPSVQIGSNFGSMIGQVMRLSDERTRSLVAAGAAGGIAAAFNAPIAAVFFALEIILGEFSGAALSIVVLSSVISAAFTQAVSGREPAFHVPAYTLNSVWDFPLYLVLGLLAGIVAALYIRAIYAIRDGFHRTTFPEWTKNVFTGLIVGGVGLVLPQVLGIGYGTISDIFAGVNLPILLLLALLFAKLLLTPLSLGGGFQGGVFAPSLYLGAVLGGAFGLAARAALPALDIAPPAFAMVGMAAVLAGAVRAPLTAILLLFEMTNDYRIILPLMFAVIISVLVSERLQHESVYTLSLLRKGIRLERGRDVEVLEGLAVSEVMTKNPPTLRAADTLDHALEAFTATHSHGFPVLDERGELVGMLTISDLENAQKQQALASAARPAAENSPSTPLNALPGAEPPGRPWTDLRVGDICSHDLIVGYAAESLASAMRRMSARDIGRMPVVEEGDPLHMVGLLRRADIIRAYEIALTRRESRRHRAAQVRLNALSQLPVEQVTVEEGSPAAGHCVSELGWPDGVIIASLRRGGQIHIPHGSTRLAPGDVIVFVSETPRASLEVQRICEK